VVLSYFGVAPLLLTTVLAGIGIWPVSNPNPVSLDILALCAFGPTLIFLVAATVVWLWKSIIVKRTWSLVMPYKRIVILTGAGISAESGIKTFRAGDGLWEECRVEDVATPEGFAADPVLVQRFYNARREQLLKNAVKPNSAHFTLAKLEREFDGELLIVTQNIDNLHERAGSNNVIHMHGELLKMRCGYTDIIYPIEGDISVDDRCECCGMRGALRPHVVWFGEMPLQMEEIYQALEACDLFIAIGTSGNVYPAAGFVQQAVVSGANTLEINIEPSAVESAFSEYRYGLASAEVPAVVAEILRMPS
jgi:NAD-dependent deacetylase